MIPQAYITAWGLQAPWPSQIQIEQDLILSRLMIEIANDSVLGPELRMRGGTCMHKLHLDKPARYSEDLDYVRSTHSGIKPYVQALRDIAANVGLEVRGVEQSGQMVHVILDADATGSSARIRVKIETNIAETTPLSKPITLPHSVDSEWWSGEADVSTFRLGELMGTKLRALYQRSKGRDLFDLWLALTTANVSPDEIIISFYHYMKETAFSYREFAPNLLDKLADANFRTDLDTLLVDPPVGYEINAAADLVVEKVGALLKNAPELNEVADGAWRTLTPSK